MIYAAWLSWLLPLIGVPLVALAAWFSARLGGWLAVAVSGGSMAAAFYAAFTLGAPTTEGYTLWFPPLAVTLQVEADQLSVLVGAFVSFVSFLVVVYSLGYMK
ncbi:MAG TPA: hypothetical protein VJR06_04445, partial [Nitrososphaerales archaeon]|nr:hypothetical protein [Nitrososphaerales archaeon]